MNHEIETEIIKKYVVKNKQDRIIWELGSPKKRSEVMWRFHHNLDIFKPECLYPVEYMDPRGMKEYLYKLSGAREVYYMGDLFIGELSLKDAADRAFGDVCIIYCGNGIAYYQGEECMAAPPRYMLIANERLRKNGIKV